MHRLIQSLVTLALVLSLTTAGSASAQAPAPGCTAPAAVCEISSRVYAIASFDPVGSAVLIAPGLLVTNRHVVADNERAEVFLADGSKVFADVVPTRYPGDLILLRSEGLGKGATDLTPGTAEEEAQVFAIGADVGRGAIRVYAPGQIRATPPAGKPLARVHHTARSQPGNSGGALVDAQGRVVAIISSGGEGRNEAIPAAEIAKLRAASGPEHLLDSGKTGEAYRKCSEALDRANASRQRLGPSNVDFLVQQCRWTGNRQLLDLAGQTLGRQRFTDEAIALFEEALDQDPNALNSRLSLAITLHTAQKFKEEIPHLKKLIEALPNDPQVLRLGIQAGTWGGDKTLADRSFALLKQHHPQLVPVAQRFIDNPPPARGARGGIRPGRGPSGRGPSGGPARGPNAEPNARPNSQPSSGPNPQQSAPPAGAR